MYLNLHRWLPSWAAISMAMWVAYHRLGAFERPGRAI